MTQHPFDTARRTAVQKFQFDDFDAVEAVSEVFEEIVPDPTFTHEDMMLARLEGETAGFARGVEETQGAIDGDVVRLLGRILAETETVIAEQKSQRDFIAAEAVKLSAAVARKVLPAMAEAGALREIETLIARCLNERPEESRLVIRLHDSMLDPVRGKIDRMIAEAGFTAKPVLLADPALKRAEVRIEWANGGVDWNFDAQLADMEASARRFAVRPAPKAKPNEITQESER